MLLLCVQGVQKAPWRPERYGRIVGQEVREAAGRQTT